RHNRSSLVTRVKLTRSTRLAAVIHGDLSCPAVPGAKLAAHVAFLPAVPRAFPIKENPQMNPNSEVSLAVRRALFMGAATTAGLATTLPAHAQDAADQSAEPEQTVTVTGTRIRRVDQETANPVFTMDQSAIASSGVSTMGELLTRVPSVS